MSSSPLGGILRRRGSVLAFEPCGVLVTLGGCPKAIDLAASKTWIILDTLDDEARRAPAQPQRRAGSRAGGRGENCAAF